MGRRFPRSRPRARHRRGRTLGARTQRGGEPLRGSAVPRYPRMAGFALDFLPAVKHREFRLQALEPDVF